MELVLQRAPCGQASSATFRRSDGVDGEKCNSRARGGEQLRKAFAECGVWEASLERRAGLGREADFLALESSQSSGPVPCWPFRPRVPELTSARELRRQDFDLVELGRRVDVVSACAE